MVLIDHIPLPTWSLCSKLQEGGRQACEPISWSICHSINAWIHIEAEGCDEEWEARGTVCAFQREPQRPHVRARATLLLGSSGARFFFVFFFLRPKDFSSFISRSLLGFFCICWKRKDEIKRRRRADWACPVTPTRPPPSNVWRNLLHFAAQWASCRPTTEHLIRPLSGDEPLQLLSSISINHL